MHAKDSPEKCPKGNDLRTAIRRFRVRVPRDVPINPQLRLPAPSPSNYSPFQIVSGVVILRTMAKVPDGWKLPNKIRNELTVDDRDRAPASLWHKSRGKCGICEEPLSDNGEGVNVDHIRPREHDGPTKLPNLQLAHSVCNKSKGTLENAVAKPVVKFTRWCRSVERAQFPQFSHVVDKYLTRGNRNLDIEYTIKGRRIKLKFGPETLEGPLFKDPAWGIDYCFAEVPKEFIRNDPDLQPRLIQADHVRDLAVDFHSEPVHEPSNCRLVPVDTDGVAQLRQFDGQHKTTAQIILGRDKVQMKIYIDPNPDLLQGLVLQIQQGIKKRPLTSSQTLAKLNEVIKARVDAYQTEHRVHPTEPELLGAQPRAQQKQFKKDLLADFEFQVFDDDHFELREYIQPVNAKRKRDYPVTEKIVIQRIIRPLICPLLQDERLDAAEGRDREREKVVEYLNIVCRELLRDKWNPQVKIADEDNPTLRARNFFYGGAVKWWVDELLVMTLKSTLFTTLEWNNRFTRELSDLQAERIPKIVETLCKWEVWSKDKDEDEDVISAWRSNTVGNVVAALPDWTHIRLNDDSLSD